MMRIVRSLLANLAALLLSLVLAVIIWVNALQIEDPTVRRSLQIPVSFIGLPENATMILPANPSQQNVLVAYEGPTSIVNEITAENFSATVDLQSENANIDVESPAPEEITVHLEALISRDIPVELEIRGSVARGHTMGEPLVDPEAITVVGTASEVERLDFARVTVFLNNDRQTVNESPEPIFYDRQGRIASVSGLQLSTNRVEVTIPINESADFANKVITVDIVGEPAPGYRVLGATVEPSSVLVTGSPTQLALPFRVQTEPIDITGLTSTFEDQVSLVLPEGITLDEVQEITATVQIEPFSSTKIYDRPVDVQGLDEELEATLDPDTVRVVLFGPSPVLDVLADQEVRVSVDLFGLEEGEYSLEPDVDIPDRGLELRSIQPSVITVDITRSVTLTREVTQTMTLNGISWWPELGNGAENNVEAATGHFGGSSFAWLPFVLLIAKRPRRKEETV